MIHQETDVEYWSRQKREREEYRAKIPTARAERKAKQSAERKAKQSAAKSALATTRGYLTVAENKVKRGERLLSYRLTHRSSCVDRNLLDRLEGLWQHEDALREAHRAAIRDLLKSTADGKTAVAARKTEIAGLTAEQQITVLDGLRETLKKVENEVKRHERLLPLRPLGWLEKLWRKETFHRETYRAAIRAAIREAIREALKTVPDASIVSIVEAVRNLTAEQQIEVQELLKATTNGC